ncbi:MULTISPECIES: HIT domain-containing protein [Halomonadaceae]|jgi:diadenosine tetraphosphate (Ap4A) HIT family hydrolase|uniref:HIT domain-containing protein n=1 Tax=Halomonadaceae TaxID=28256 RepID=UPI001581A0AB|nr:MULTISPECIES: HIT domain-containing protein [Halomonas]MDI4639139.1 HIT domain-containing protein [Halomonas sp. BMC7]NUJ60131.1 HIT domain-containing protein [Halomonas taeanensis]|tara:strand:- start:28573 stop:28995 length:423 start_codon:yes stop_codon:yes gene_type:complete
MSDFTLHPRLAADTLLITDLPLCQVRLMNDARYAWLVLVPRRDDIREVYELSAADQAQLWKEATALGKALMAAREGDKLNLATLGNMVPQLHLHVIVRHAGDAAWPGPVWGQGSALAYDANQEAAMRACLEECLTQSGLG